VTTNDRVDHGVLVRLLLLYGAYNLIHNFVFLLAYHLFPPGFLKGTHVMAIASWVGSAGGLWGVFGRTLLMNLGVMGTICVLLNLQRVRTIPLGYTVPLFLGVTTGLALGTNSFAGIDLSNIPFRAGTAEGLSIGGAEMLGYMCLIAATSRISMYQRQTWWRWSEYFVRIRRISDLRLSLSEIVVLVAGIGLIVLGAYRETW
jgi:hypothetical protein